ncbi:MAG: phosphonate C-P lyase system protein PhnH [Deltaproteobacteria bacterium]|jgi:alpha-D-ribose 1-methylphosphonate 5-triphosphate synthase subunit PhnH|nr:phosphonate C-P lyase system protein PhnH [Deltaproteobacteria bacterium]
MKTNQDQKKSGPKVAEIKASDPGALEAELGEKSPFPGRGENPGPGFEDYALASQVVYRLALSAMAKPTKRFFYDFKSLIKSPPPLPYVVAALALTLCDHLTPVWLSPSFEKAESFLVFHGSVPIVREPAKADFVLCAGLGEMPNLAELNQGDPRYPDRSTTVILGRAFEELDSGLDLWAFGPGLEDETVFQNHGLDRQFVAQWALNRAGYPLGLDVFLAGSDWLAALPRSLTLRLKAS